MTDLDHIDRLVAEQIMGLESVRTQGAGIEVGWRPKGLDVGVSPLPLYSSDLLVAWQLVERFRMRVYAPGSLGDQGTVSDSRFWTVTCAWLIDPPEDEYDFVYQTADTPPLAICLAALSSFGVCPPDPARSAS